MSQLALLALVTVPCVIDTSPTFVDDPAVVATAPVKVWLLYMPRLVPVPSAATANVKAGLASPYTRVLLSAVTVTARRLIVKVPSTKVMSQLALLALVTVFCVIAAVPTLLAWVAAVVTAPVKVWLLYMPRLVPVPSAATANVKAGLVSPYTRALLSAVTVTGRRFTVKVPLVYVNSQLAAAKLLAADVIVQVLTFEAAVAAVLMVGAPVMPADVAFSLFTYPVMVWLKLGLASPYTRALLSAVTVKVALLMVKVPGA